VRRVARVGVQAGGRVYAAPERHLLGVGRRQKGHRTMSVSVPARTMELLGYGKRTERVRAHIGQRFV